MTSTIVLPKGFEWEPSASVDVVHAVPRGYEIRTPYWRDDAHTAIHCQFKYPHTEVFAIVNKLLTDGSPNADFEYILSMFSSETLQRNTDGVREREQEEKEQATRTDLSRREDLANTHLRTVKIELLALPEIKDSKAYDLKAKIKGSGSVSAACAYAGALIAQEAMQYEAIISQSRRLL